MNTTHYKCGCSISRSIKPPFPVLDVNVCNKHTKERTIQLSLEKLAGNVSSMGIPEHEPSAMPKVTP